MIKLQVDVVSTQNAEQLALKCLLDLRSVVEDCRNLSIAKSQRQNK